MKIAIVAEAVETHSGSRAEIELAKQFVHFGHDVNFYAHFSPSTPQAKKELEKEGVKVFLIKSPSFRFGRLVGGLKLTRMLTKDKPDIISTHTTIPFAIGARLSGITTVSTYYGTQLDVWFDRIFPRKPKLLDQMLNSAINWLITTIVFLQLHLSSRVLTQSQFCSDEIKKMYGYKAPIIFWGDAPPHLLNVTKSKRNSKKIKLLSVSRIIPYKGFHTLISIVKELNKEFDNLELTIIGSHPNKTYLAYLKKIKPKNVRIVVDASDEVLAKEYQDADIYLTADKFLFFGQPVLEAASFGKPTITLNNAAANEVVINGQTGIVSQDSEEFRDSLMELIKSPKTRLLMGKNAKCFAQNHNWEKCAKSYLKYLSKWAKD